VACFRLLGALVVLVLAAAAAPAAQASTAVRFGIQDDAWLLEAGPELESRVAELDALGIEVVRFNLRWDQTAPSPPEQPREPSDPAYEWTATDGVLGALRASGIDVLLTIFGTPGWANGGGEANVAPFEASAMGDFAAAAAARYPWVKLWAIWNEPNQRKWLTPTSPSVYVERLLNPAYASIHAAIPGARVAGGVTAPRGLSGGMSPVAWIRGMGQGDALLDAYAHNPYPLEPQRETPASGGCGHCLTITMATLERLLSEVRKAFGSSTRIWLTEYGYQTNPPDRVLGISESLQARYLGEAALRVWRAPRVDVLINFLYRDEPRVDRWQSGLLRVNDSRKPSHSAFRLPLAQVSRTGTRTVLFGQVRPREGRQPYRLQIRASSRWSWAGPAAMTDSRGFFRKAVSVKRGAHVRVHSPRDGAFGAPLRIR
jgi:hypothetical protein